ncbi:MAG: EAL domain-containing protein [Methylobacter sp.]|uniref:bifunctional diguanylate cyclase/phosphodiesterase n=1 Tax=Methylobacter sp. TaxID=2051955 RepID=UPI0027318488|nr:EAL domain-containing protein [Methylobacter sp.]MDP1667107.1 EAL domain-containing protein [Methylobacter sp.]
MHRHDQFDIINLSDQNTVQLEFNAAMKDAQISRLKKLFELSLTLSGDPMEIFQHAAKMIGELLEVKIVCLSEIQGEQLNFLAVCMDGEIYSNAGSCLLAITPCATVEQSKDIQVYDRVKELFPEAAFLQDHNAVAYCGFPSLDNHGKVVAVTCLLDDKPHDFTSEDQAVLRIIGQRIGMEIERKHNLEEKERVSEILRLNEDRLHQATRVSGTGIFEQNYCNDSIYCSPELRTHFGWKADELVTAQTFSASIHPEDKKRVIEAIRHVQTPSGNGLLDIDYRIFRQGAEIRWLTTRSQTFFKTDGEACRAVRTVGAVRDITKKKLAEQEQRIFATAFQTQEGIIVTDANQIIVRVNQAFTNITGYSTEEAIGNRPSMLKSGRHDSLFYHEIHKILDSEGYWQGEILDRHKDGHTYPKWLTITAVKDGDDKTTHYVGNFSDITERKRAEEHIHYLANFDPLTGLPNRAQLNDHLNYALSLAKRSNGHLALMFLDLDHFKDINDSLGHSIGDVLLIELSKRLRMALREEDTVTRLGGDEFILLLPGVDAIGAAHVAQKLLNTIAESYRIEHYDLALTASVGIALYPEDGENLEALSKSADTAMYRAKQEGRQCYRFFTQEMQASSARNLQLVNALRHALERDQLQVYYQPQVSMREDRIIGAEALLRWQHPELGGVSPAEFIPVAEGSGLILPIGEWVLRCAVRQAKVWMDEGFGPLVMAVNLSAVQFRHPDLPELVTRILDEEGLPPEYLELELTEGVAMHNPQGAIAVMNNLHERGIRMSIDDFGTGYSSLSYLKKFKVYKLKIDQSFVRDISTDPEDKAIVSAIINLAKSLGLKIIAEGVETAGQQAFLHEQGCDEMQGYLFSKPVSAEQLDALLKQGFAV